MYHSPSAKSTRIGHFIGLDSCSAVMLKLPTDLLVWVNRTNQIVCVSAV